MLPSRFVQRPPALRRLLSAAAAAFASACVAASPAAAQTPPTVAGLKNPESVAVVGDKVFVSVIGDFGKDGDGAVVQIVDGRAKPFATGLDDPKGLAAVGDALFVTDKVRVMKIAADGKVSEFAPAKAFKPIALFLNDVVSDAQGNLYVSDSGDLQGHGGKVFQITPEGKVSLVVEDRQAPQLKTPNGLFLEAEGKLLLADFASGDLWRIDLATKKLEKLNSGLEGSDGVARDGQGRLLVTSWQTGKIHRIPADLKGKAEVVSKEKEFESPADAALSPDGKHLIVPEMKAGKVVWFPLP